MFSVDDRVITRWTGRGTHRAAADDRDPQ